MDNNYIMTTKEIAGYIKLNEKTVIRLAQSGKLPAIKIGKQWRFRLRDISAYMQNEITPTTDKNSDLFAETTGDVIPLSRLTDKSLIDLDVGAGNVDDVLARLARIAYKNGLALSEKNLLENLRAREKMLSTAIGNEIAIPHPRHPSPELFRDSKIIIVRLKNAVDYAAPDGKPVRVFFMVCAQNELIHLRLLAKLSKLLQAPRTISKLLRAGGKDEIVKLLLEFDKTRLFSGRKPKGGVRWR